MTSPDRIARLRISLEEIEPEIWRRVEVPLAVPLKGLHDVIQAAMGWEDYHLFEFRVGRKIYGIPDPAWDVDRKVMNARSVRLAALVAKGIDRLEYVYDLGDNWRHVVTIEAVGPPAPAQLYPRFMDGARLAHPKTSAASSATTSSSRPSASQACGSTPLSLAVPIRLYITAARSPPRSGPQNSQDLRPSAMPRSARSAALLLTQIRPSSRKRVNAGQRLSR